MKLDMNAAMTASERFTHIQVEMHERALPMERFDYEFEREPAAAFRLKLPQVVIAWLHELNDER